MAHSNACAQAAQAKFLSLTHHFGCPKVMFTVSFDDSLDIRILPLSGKEDTLQWVSSLSEMSSQALEEEMEVLKAVRFKYPGICALNFETLLDLVLTKLVGDNHEKTGIFGKLAAYGVAVEEQGRITLHAHIIIYILGWNELLQRLQSPDKRIQQKAEKEVVEFIDSCLSTELVPDSCKDITCFECKQDILQFVPHQELRFLRHRLGCKVHNGCIAICPNCEAHFRANDIALKKAVPEMDISTLSQEEVHATVAYQVLKSTSPLKTTTIQSKSIGIINYQFNHHLDQHTKTCFKKGDEGRCCLPDIPEPRTRVLVSEKKHETFNWCGGKELQSNITIRPRRFWHDAFTNTYCKFMSACKAPCNSNVGITTGARATIYASCYSAKGTQKEDTEEYLRMASYVGNRFQQQRRENTLFEGLSRLMGAVIVGTSEHVCAAPMAAYLVRNESRFTFSVDFKYIPIRELSSILNNTINSSTMEMTILGHETGCFLTNEALHYLHRPVALGYLSVFDFFQQYEIVRKGNTSSENSQQELFDFEDPDHPGILKQVVRQRNKPVYAQVSHWSFPDAASFAGNIFDLDIAHVNQSVEDYCKHVLLLFHPFRNLQDISSNGSYHQKFLECFPHKIVPPHMNTFLANIQMFYNSIHLPAKDDPLSDLTTAYSNSTTPVEPEVTDEEDCFVDGFFNVCNPLEDDLQDSESSELNICLSNLRKAGARRCGFQNIPTMNPSSESLSVPNCFVSMQQSGTQVVHFQSTNAQNTSKKRSIPNMIDLMELTFQGSRRRLQMGTYITSSPIDADGSASSIIQWSRRPELNFDAEQSMAFQIATAAFVLTYYKDARDLGKPCIFPSSSLSPALARNMFTSEKTLLTQLARLSRATPYLRMFLDGPAGSGKSHVVRALLGYAEAYTKNIQDTFDMRTIIVTALSGVAATAIGGETLHSAAALNRTIDSERDSSWINARLLIIDECSFMDVTQIETLDGKLRLLTHRHLAVFGGLHIVFCGDFRQLEPITGKPLYSARHTERKWLNSINCYIELQGLHRFREDPEWGMILRRIRNAKPKSSDIEAINDCVIGTRTIPNNASFCVYSNCDRSAINAGIFSNFLTQHSVPHPLLPEQILVIRGSNIQRKLKNGSMANFHTHDLKYLFQNCGDFRVTTTTRGGKGHFVDPLLKLYYNIPLMFVSNDDVPNGHANGTRVLLKSIVLNPGCTSDTITIQGQQCQSVEAHSVQHLVCTLDGNDSKIFHVTPKTTTCYVKAPLPNHFGATTDATITFKICMTQFPVLVNNATTGHKLQGQTKENLVISVWSKKKNWNYVALSRVTKRQGLYLVSPLPHDVDFSMSRELVQMLQTLKTKRPVPFELNS